MVRGSIFLVFLVLTSAVFLLEPASEAALSCPDLSPAVMQCASFALGTVSQPSGECCSELSRLVGIAKTTDDKRQACNCLKQVAPQYPGAKESNLLALPKKCGVSLPFSITRDTDCSKVT